MKKLLTIICSLMLGACSAPRDQAYCDSFHLHRESTEYANCKAYFAKMDYRFQSDYAACGTKASAAIPEYLYDHPRYGQTETIDRFGYLRTSNIMIEPDFQKNNSLDTERRKIIAPCMLGKGWKSPDTWEAGRVDQQPLQNF